MTHLSLHDFVNEYDLYDKGVDAITREGHVVKFTFSLFHCDDLNRDDERKNYMLDVTFSADHIMMIGDAIEVLGPVNWGEVLHAQFDEKVLKLGVTWKAGSETRWTDIAVSGDPEFVRETISGRSSS